jgi:hypothetical protein
MSGALLSLKCTLFFPALTPFTTAFLTLLQDPP